MKKKQDQKRRKKWRTLILLLFITIIMFGTSTYAWFTANRVVTINDINVQVQASNGIQISTDAQNWKSVITNADITTNAYSGNNNQLPGVVTAVSTNGAVDTATGATKGNLIMYYGVVDTDANSGDYVITATRDTEPGGTSGHFVAFDIFLRVDQNTKVYLTPDSNVVASGTDKGLKNAARIGFAYKGHGAVDATQETLLAINDPNSTAVIWEPNSDGHSVAVVNSVAPDYDVDVTGNQVTYFGLNGPIETAAKLKPIVKTGKIESTTYADRMTPKAVTTVSNSTYTEFLDLTAGVTRYRVYMWIEGQDIDCENGATGSNITFQLQLSTENPSSSSGASSSSSESSSASSSSE